MNDLLETLERTLPTLKDPTTNITKCIENSKDEEQCYNRVLALLYVTAKLKNKMLFEYIDNRYSDRECIHPDDKLVEVFEKLFMETFRSGDKVWRAKLVDIADLFVLNYSHIIFKLIYDYHDYKSVAELVEMAELDREDYWFEFAWLVKNN